MNEHPNALSNGFNIQEYEIVRVLGSGGFAITYLAFDNNMDRGCAIKEYLPRYLAFRESGNTVVARSTKARTEFDWGLDRFLSEARTLAKFDHPNIVKVYRSFTDNDTGYIVMEYAEGDTLAEYLEHKGTLNEIELKAILMPVLTGLSKVHAVDFLHRDIKPLNVIIRDSDNSGVLIDFGSARRAIGEKDKHLTTLVSGGYAPIEQYSSSGDQGPWTDIYALGALCYRALSGENPYEATARLKDDPLVPISKRCQDNVSNDFLSAIDWALQVHAKDRPQNVSEWIAAIEGETRAAFIPNSQERRTSIYFSYVAAFTSVIVIAGAAVWYFALLPDSGPISSTDTIPGVPLPSSQDKTSESSNEPNTAEQEVVGTEMDVFVREPELILIAAGSFRMGDPKGIGDFDEMPVHQVDLASDFYISKYEVTFAEFDNFAVATGRELPDDEGWGRGNRPVINVSWPDAAAYAEWLSDNTDQSYRLPSEAEWEYAAKSSSETNYPWGDEIGTNRANCRLCRADSSQEGTQPVGSYSTIQSGLHDMQGNVWEWVKDCAHDGYFGAPADGTAWESDPACSRIIRGGAWNSSPFQLRSSYRSWRPTEDFDNTVGFRLVREVN